MVKPLVGSGVRMEGAYRTLLPLAAFVVLIVVNLLLTKNFGHIEVKDGRLYGAIIDIFHRGTPIMLIAIGMTLVIATRGIDLSVGSVVAITAAVAAVLLANTAHPTPVPLVILVGLGVGCLAGLWNGMLVAYLNIQPIVATLILMVAGRGIAQLITQGQIPTFHSDSFEWIGRGSILGIPVSIFIAAGVLLIAVFLARKTVVGTYIEAVGGNESASHYSGVDVNLVKLLVYIASGLCAAIAGLLLTADYAFADGNNFGLNYELDAILSVVIGGTLFSGGRFNLAGSVIGALVMRTLTISIEMNGVNPAYTLVVEAVIVVVVCAVQSTSVRASLGKLVFRRSPE